jgi:hypothetical protein
MQSTLAGSGLADRSDDSPTVLLGAEAVVLAA